MNGEPALGSAASVVVLEGEGVEVSECKSPVSKATSSAAPSGATTGAPPTKDDPNANKNSASCNRVAAVAGYSGSSQQLLLQEDEATRQLLVLQEAKLPLTSDTTLPPFDSECSFPLPMLDTTDPPDFDDDEQQAQCCSALLLQRDDQTLKPEIPSRQSTGCQQDEERKKQTLPTLERTKRIRRAGAVMNDSNELQHNKKAKMEQLQQAIINTSQSTQQCGLGTATAASDTRVNDHSIPSVHSGTQPLASTTTSCMLSVSADHMGASNGTDGLTSTTATISSCPSAGKSGATANPGTLRSGVSKHDEKWNAMFQRLIEYKNAHNTTLIPQLYNADPRLGRWVHYQRVEYWVYQSHGKAKITPDRIARLDSIGFEWDPQRAQWNAMYDKLLKFHGKHGHCKVPKGYADDTELANWVRNQRLEHANLQRGKKTRMTSERYEKLDQIGFKWSVVYRPPTTTTTTTTTTMTTAAEPPACVPVLKAKNGGPSIENSNDHGTALSPRSDCTDQQPATRP